MIFFSADHHFNHKNIIEYTKRPFRNVEEMDEELIKKWNEKISTRDLVFYLGDFCFGNTITALSYVKRLNGFIYFLNYPDHHDKYWIEDTSILMGIRWNFKILPALWEIEHVNKERILIVLFHFPIEEWNKKHYGSIHLHGHSHGNSREIKNRFDVGVDTNNFYPTSMEEILERRII